MIRGLAIAAVLLAVLVPVASAQTADQSETCVTLYAFEYDLGPYHVSNPNNIKIVCVGPIEQQQLPLAIPAA